MISLDDANFLKEVLAHTSDIVGINNNVWYVNDGNMIRVAEILEDECKLSTAKEAIYFFEKPWKWESDLQELDSLQESLGDWRHKGFTLAEEGDHVLVLYYHNEEILRGAQTSPRLTKEFLQNICAAHLRTLQPGGEA